MSLYASIEQSERVSSRAPGGYGCLSAKKSRGTNMATEPVHPGNSFRSGFTLTKGLLPDRLTLMLNSRLFANLSYSEIEEVAALAQDKCFERNAVLFRQG